MGFLSFHVCFCTIFKRLTQHNKMFKLKFFLYISWIIIVSLSQISTGPKQANFNYSVLMQYLSLSFHPDVKRSALGLLLWIVVLTTWITIFQHYRAQWGEVGDSLSFTIPLGIP